MDFYIKTKELADMALRLQRINSVALPIAVQNTLNNVARDIKVNTLKSTTESMFDIQRKSFFKANSGYQQHKATKFRYNINKMVATAGITKSTKPKEKATEQVAHQQTATPIKRSINPLGNKPLKKDVIKILNQKPEFFQWNKTSESEFDRNDSIYRFMRTAARAYKHNRAFVMLSSSSGSGAVYKVNRFNKNENYGGTRDLAWNSTVRSRHRDGLVIRRNGKRYMRVKDNRVHIIEMENIASYRKGGHVKLNKRSPFLQEAAATSMKSMMKKEFYKQARYQLQRAMKK